MEKRVLEGIHYTIFTIKIFNYNFKKKKKNIK